MTELKLKFNAPPGWPKPPEGWSPPKGWTPDPSWPPPPEGWRLWVPADGDTSAAPDEVQRSEGSSEVPGSNGQSELERRLSILAAENAALRSQLERAVHADEIVVLDDEAILQEVGIYRYHHPLETADAYRDRLSEINSRIAEMIKAQEAISMSNTFTFDNSLAKGRRMTGDLAKLMLRAYNAEVDNSLRALRAGNVVTAKKRVEASRGAIKKLGKIMEMEISDAYHALRITELELAADYLMKKQEEREAAREERARLREERRVEAELAAEREKLAKEREHLLNAIEALRREGKSDADLAERLDQVDKAIEQNDFRAANIRAGYVYVISNRGAFGKGVVKIGLTRRLEPLNRVNELSGASVPFQFDVHCMIFAEDAVTLEADLHEHFKDRRVNCANPRKEFFFASPKDVRAALDGRVGKLLEFVETAESTEYLQSVKYWPQDRRHSGER